ncbi:hypothetical protein IQ260_12450 [Leptolyngbya cf. ectocarpi LEGE 11479]|uniref:Uncharacterized protein n=1 Tax=Leptolyngbya cf. ectocarpi LEGE 11479 TaxID=1828722 RepID=A0A928ZU31_LEPEC|nr:hypothetical protein [Leptolyngbya ectocarpi]MBE9067468.1 hypothetical protein [Leptolyngbya cf. ectocarpi LEGE 11479]
MDFDTKQIVGQLLLGMGALGIVLAPASQVFSADQPATKPQTTQSELTIASPNRVFNLKQESAVPGNFTRYDSAKFSVDYPREWQATPQGDSSVAIVSITDGVTMPIQTNITVLREDPERAVPQKLDQIVADAVTVQRYSLVAVDGQSGFRIWYEPEPGQQAIVTFVGYGNQQTAILSSSYEPDTEAETLVTQIHGSFVNHTVTQATTP